MSTSYLTVAMDNGACDAVSVILNLQPYTNSGTMRIGDINSRFLCCLSVPGASAGCDEVEDSRLRSRTLEVFRRIRRSKCASTKLRCDVYESPKGSRHVSIVTVWGIQQFEIGCEACGREALLWSGGAAVLARAADRRTAYFVVDDLNSAPSLASPTSLRSSRRLV